MNLKVVVVALLIVIAVIVGSVVAYFALLKPEIIDPWQEGSWQQRVYVTFEDGTEKELNSLGLLAVTDLVGMEVDYIRYVLEMKATGEGYNHVTITFNDFYVEIQTREGSADDPVHVYNSITLQDTEHLKVAKPVDGQWYEVWSINRDIDDYFPTGGGSDITPGVYKLKFAPKGTIQYKGTDLQGNVDSEYSTADLPSDFWAFPFYYEETKTLKIEWRTSLEGAN